ncbi:NAD(P)/FAD-dependent oxidoreductase [Deltaproteobacteria bacterium TL4]
MKTIEVAIIGAGPAGLTAAYLLSKHGIPVIVFEADPEYVGGISKTANYKGFHFDIGGHRFFSKSREVEDFWTEILPHDMLERPRSSRIFYRGKYFSYPLKAVEALLNLGIVEAILCILSYLKAQLFPVTKPKNFEDWVSNQFGKRLFNIFFKTYTEKVWGMSCKDISADWAAQRIKGLSLASAVFNALLPKRKPKDRSKVIKTLIDAFRYPRKGPGMMWETCAQKIEGLGGVVQMGSPVTGGAFDEQTQLWTIAFETREKGRESVQARHVISSAPLRELILSLKPQLADEVLKAARALKYRDFLTVMLILKDTQLFSDNWIYIHDPGVQVGRIQNFKSWSPEMVPDPALCCYGLEYFCFEGDNLWESKDQALIEKAKEELEKIGLAKVEDIMDGCVVRQKKAYPVYDESYADHVSTIRQALEKQFPTLHVIGRNGMHKYNNQDHAMMTAMLTVSNIEAGKRVYDVWQVNEDAEYHESGEAGTENLSTGRRQTPSS